jgi:hypothetical protein
MEGGVVKPETRVLRVVRQENGGPRKRSVLEGIAEKHGGSARTVSALISDGRLVKRVSARRWTLWGLPKEKAQ